MAILLQKGNSQQVLKAKKRRGFFIQRKFEHKMKAYVSMFWIKFFCEPMRKIFGQKDEHFSKLYQK